MDWNGVAAACRKVPGGAGSGELLKSGQGADDLGVSMTMFGVLERTSAAAQSTAGSVRRRICVLRLVLDFQSFKRRHHTKKKHIRG
jgi:hypothetical protein